MERISIEGAAAALLARLSPLPGRERVPLSALPGRVLAEDVFARLDVPPFDRSPLDGYALRSADLAGAGPGAPALLRVAVPELLWSLCFVCLLYPWFSWVRRRIIKFLRL